MDSQEKALQEGAQNEVKAEAAVTPTPAEEVPVEAAPVEEAPAPEPMPETKPAITLEKVRAVLADKSRAGHTAEVRALLEKHGATKLSQVDPQHYEAILKEAEGFGNAT